jgi:hypothetical protein
MFEPTIQVATIVLSAARGLLRKALKNWNAQKASSRRRPRAYLVPLHRFHTAHIQYNSQPSVAADPAMALSFIDPAASAIQRHARRPLLSTTACASP